MAGKRGIRNVPGMRHRKTGGKKSEGPDGFDRSDAGTLASQVDAWFARLEERNYSPRTLDMHRWALKSFLEWCHERGLRRPEQIDKPILESFQRWLFRYRKKNGQPLSIATQRSRLGAVQRFFAHLCKTNHLPANPAADLELPRKMYRQLPKGLSRQELHQLLNVPDVRDPLGIRDRAILETFYATGARRSELVRFDLSDLDPEAGTMHIRQGKGGKSRLVPVGESALHWIARYLKECRPRLVLEAGEHALFLSGYGARFNANYLGNWVTRTIKAAEIGKTGSCHLLRHTCAQHMLEGGADIRFIQQLLGHARLDTTQIYTEVGIKALREVYRRTHPAAQHGKPEAGHEDQDGAEP